MRQSRETDNVWFSRGKERYRQQKLRWTDEIATPTKELTCMYSWYTRAQNQKEWKNFIKIVTNNQA